jgi:hypothetical protein
MSEFNGQMFLSAMMEQAKQPMMKGMQLAEVEYRAMPAVNNSMLKQMEYSPNRFKYEMEHPREATPALELGSAIHMAILEPEKFDECYSIKPKFDRRTKAGKEGSEKWEAANGSRLAITDDDMDIVHRVCQRTFDNDQFSRYFKTGMKEGVFTAIDPETGLLLKGKLDNYMPDLNVIVDLKTTDCAAPHTFNYDITKYKYYIQAAFYMDLVELAMGVRPDAFAIIAVEKSRNCDIAKFTFEPADLEIGRKEYRRWLNQLAACLKTNVWSGYDSEWNIWKPSRYMIEADF